MTWRTPSSLKWLIVKRSRISGALIGLDAERTKLIDRLNYIDCKTETLRRQLSALDQTFGLHEISVSPEDIRPVQPQIGKRLLPHGKLSRVIFAELRTAGDWLSTTELIVRVIKYLADAPDRDYEEIRTAVRKRLGKLCRDGALERKSFVSAAGKHDGQTENFWRLAIVSRKSSIYLTQQV